MSTLRLTRYVQAKTGGARLGIQLGESVHDVTTYFATPGTWLRSSVGRVDQAISDLAQLARSAPSTLPVTALDNPPESGQPHWLAPVWEQDVWAAGVTYERSRAARQAEAIDGGDVYARVYAAERPELFFKAHGRHVIGPRGAVGIRADAAWSVPEPELAVVMNPAMEVVGFTAGNDVSSRDIEGENPLYLPQAKVYTASCALGPGILLAPSDIWPDTTIHLTIQRGNTTAFEGDVHTARIHRTLSDLITYLGRSNTFPDGVVLLTGTGIVPPDDFTLMPGDVVTITIDGIGTLTNPVKTV